MNVNATIDFEEIARSANKNESIEMVEMLLKERCSYDFDIRIFVIIMREIIDTIQDDLVHKKVKIEIYEIVKQYVSELNEAFHGSNK